jgi:hypothetical protein
MDAVDFESMVEEYRPRYYYPDGKPIPDEDEDY